MQSVRTLLVAGFFGMVAGATITASASQDNPAPIGRPDLGGLHDFDLREGHWLAHHRRLKERLINNHEWQEFDGTCDFRSLMNGRANEDDNVFEMPGGEYRGVSLRAYDPKTGLWAIWWLDGRMPFNNLDPPVKGRFVRVSARSTPRTRCMENRSECASSGRT